MQAQNTHTLIVGSGFSGLGLGIQLLKSGIDDFIIIEKAAGVGGTWRDNTYPDAACDVPAHLYSFSYEKNPNWSRVYAKQPEILAYLESCAEKYHLLEKIIFNTEYVSAKFDDINQLWQITSRDGKKFVAKFLVFAVGPFAAPQIPKISGLESFTGKILHSAKWNKDIDFKNKNVALIGTGASAIQIGPAIAPICKTLTVFQRSAPWIIPKADYAIPNFSKKAQRKWPWLMTLRRLFILMLTEIFGPFVFLDRKFPKSLLEMYSIRFAKKQMPHFRPEVIPNYKLGCKRILLSNDWYPTLDRKNVKLIPEGLAKIKGSTLNSETHSCENIDIIVFATGQTSIPDPQEFTTIGTNGTSIQDVWKDRPFAHKGMTVNGFPNMFLMLGPNTGPGHTSALLYTEAQAKHIAGAIRYMKKNNYRSLSVDPKTITAYQEFLNHKMKRMVWTSGSCHSWYLNDKGENFNLYPGFAMDYYLRAHKFNPKEYIFL